MPTYELIFEDPPDRREMELSEVLRQLYEHPNRWAIVASYEGKQTAYTKQKKFKDKGAPLPGTWEWDYVTLEGGSRLYAKYMGGHPDYPYDPAAHEEPEEPGPPIETRDANNEVSEARRRRAAADAT